MKEKREVIAENIYELRKKKGYSQYELANMLNYSDKVISKWERAESMPDVDSLYNLSVIFGVSVDYFFCEKEEEKAKYIKESNNDFVNKLLILLLFCVSFMGIALVIFFTGQIRNWESKNNLWVSFIHATPLCAIACYIFFKKIHIKLGVTISLSALVWTILATIYFTALVLGEQMWMIYLLGIPIQAALILLFFIKKEN